MHFVFFLANLFVLLKIFSKLNRNPCFWYDHFQNPAAEPPNGTVAAQDGQQDVANGNAAQQQQQQRPDGWSMVKGFIIRLVIIYFISSLFRRGQPPAPSAGPDGAPVSSGPRPPSTNMFPKGASLDLYVYLSDSDRFTDFNNSEALFWKKTGLIYGDWESGENSDGVHSFKSQIRTPARVLQNTSMHMHLFFVRSGKSPDPASRLYSKKYTIHRSKGKSQCGNQKKKENAPMHFIQGYYLFETALQLILLKKEIQYRKLIE